MSYLTAGCRKQWEMFKILASNRARMLQTESANRCKSTLSREYYKEVAIMRGDLENKIGLETAEAEEFMRSMSIRTS